MVWNLARIKGLGDLEWRGLAGRLWFARWCTDGSRHCSRQHGVTRCVKTRLVAEGIEDTSREA